MNILFEIQPVNIEKKRKLAHLMTAEEYTAIVAPLFAELKLILRKKYFFNEHHYSFSFFTYDDFLKKAQQTENPYAIQDCIDLLTLNKIKKTQVPSEMLANFSSLLGEIKSFFDERDLHFFNEITKSNKKIVRYCLDKRFCLDIINNKLSLEELEIICDSHNLKMPTRILKLNIDNVDTLRGNLPPKSKTFYDKLLSETKPFHNELRKIHTEQINQLVKEFPIKLGDSIDDAFYANVLLKTDSKSLLILSKISQIGFDETVRLECDLFIFNMLSKFIYRIEDKLRNVNNKANVLDIKFENTHFNKGVIETNASFMFDNEQHISCNASLIIAGGCIQRLHYRFLTSFWFNGTKQSQKQLDNLFS